MEVKLTSVYNEILYSHIIEYQYSNENKQTTTTCNNMKESQKKMLNIKRVILIIPFT